MSIAPPEQSTAPSTASPDLDLGALGELDQPWITLVHNDPVNLMSYVTWVFMRHFGYSRARAEALMLDVHEKGRAVVSRGTRERMELDTEAMQGYGLWATFQKDD